MKCQGEKVKQERGAEVSGAGLKLKRGQSGRGLLSEHPGEMQSPHADWDD